MQVEPAVVLDLIQELAEAVGPVVIYQDDRGQIVVGVLNWVEIDAEKDLLENPQPLSRIDQLVETIG